MPLPRPPSSLSRVPWWLVILVALGGTLVALGLSTQQYRDIFYLVGFGLVVTVRVTVISFLCALALGTGLALCLLSPRRWLAEVSRSYVELVRGVPMLVLLAFLAQGAIPALFAGYGNAFADLIAKGTLPAITLRDFGFEPRVILALALAYSAFIAEIMRAGILAVPIGQSEAAQALGLTRMKTMRLIVLPQAFKTMIPPLGNDLVSLLKDSSLVSVLGVTDITQLGKTYSAGTFLFFQTYAVVAFYYLVMTISLSILVRHLEKRLRRNEGR